MSYLNRANGYAPTGRVNSEPVTAGTKIRTVHSAQWGSLTGEVVSIDAHDVRIRWDHSVPGTANAHVSAAQRGVTPSGLLYTRGEFDRNVAAGRFLFDQAGAEGIDNPAFDTVDGATCPDCAAPRLRTWQGGFADEPPAVPHTECGACGRTT